MRALLVFLLASPCLAVPLVSPVAGNANVLDYGAAPDCIVDGQGVIQSGTDLGPPLQMALDALAMTAVGGRVDLPAGSYCLRTGVHATGVPHLVIDGSAGAVIYVAAPMQDAFAFTGGGTLDVQHLILAGDNQTVAANAAHVFRTQGNTHVLFDDVQFYGILAYDPITWRGAVMWSTDDHFEFAHSAIYGTGAQPVGASIYSSANTLIRDSKFQDYGVGPRGVFYNKGSDFGVQAWVAALAPQGFGAPARQEFVIDGCTFDEDAQWQVWALSIGEQGGNVSRRHELVIRNSSFLAPVFGSARVVDAKDVDVLTMENVQVGMRSWGDFEVSCFDCREMNLRNVFGTPSSFFFSEDPPGDPTELVYVQARALDFSAPLERVNVDGCRGLALTGIDPDALLAVDGALPSRTTRAQPAGTEAWDAALGRPVWSNGNGGWVFCDGSVAQ